MGFLGMAILGFLVGWAVQLVPVRGKKPIEYIIGLVGTLLSFILPRGAEDGFGPAITIVMFFGVAVFAITRVIFNRNSTTA